MEKLQSRLAKVALLPLTLALTLSAAAQDRDISITVEAADSGRLKEVRKTLAAFPPDVLGSTPPWTVPVRITTSVIFDSLVLATEWNDGTKISVHLNIHSSLTKPPYYVYLAKPPVSFDEDKLDRNIREQCVVRQASDTKDAFEQMQTCKAYALHVRGPDDAFGERYLKALRGWYQANAFLYTLIPPVSIYALDPDLVTRLRELLNTEQSIIGLANVRRTIVDFETQMVSLASSVRSPTGEQADQIRIAACKQLNEMTYPGYYKRIHGDPSDVERSIGIQQRHRQALNLQRCAK